MNEKMNDYRKELNLDSDTFSNMKRDLTFVLQRLLGNMQEKGAEEGSIGLKLDVKLVPEFIPCYDDDGNRTNRKIEKPQFKHKITSTLQIKDEKSGNLDTEMELVFDEDSGEYVMKPIANTTQRSIFDSDFEQNVGMPAPEDSETDETALPGGERPALPDLSGTSDVIDGEYTEVQDVTDELLDDSSEDKGDDADNKDTDGKDSEEEDEE